MVNFTVDQIRSMMQNKENIRNISVIAHVDHGKSTLTDSLVSKAGIIANAKAGEARFTDTREDEQERAITIKSTSISLYYKSQREKVKGEYLINLIDSPGHVDFSSEVTAALRVTDGSLVVVDCVEGVCTQTETVLRQSLSEQVHPVLFLNKMDRIFIEIKSEPEETYTNLRNIIEQINVIIETYNSSGISMQVDPAKGNVGFGSGVHAWGFTLDQIAELYHKGDSKDVIAHREKLRKKLWGDNFYNPKTKKWIKIAKKGYIRGFCHFVLKPINTIIRSCLDDQLKKVEKFIKVNKIDMPEKRETFTPKELMKCTMRTWLPAGDALLEMIVAHIPSPSEAQKYRYKHLYTGSSDDKHAISIRDCNQEGPLVLYISKMVPANETGKFYAFGRVFSGKVHSGKRVRIIGPNFNAETGSDNYIKSIQRTVLMMGRYVEQIIDVPAGNVVGLVGVDDVILKSATIVDCTEKCCGMIKPMVFSVSPVVSQAVDLKNAQELPKLVEALKKLSKSDPLVVVSRNSSGQHVISGAGELHLEICMKDLQDYLKNTKLITSDPIVTFCETINSESSQICISKSANRHNRLQMISEPLNDKLCEEIEAKRLCETNDVKERAKRLINEFDWDPTDARKIWAFGCQPDGVANILVDSTRGIQYLNEIKESVNNAFKKATLYGVIAEERMRGCCFKLVDATLHADAIHRGAGQITPAARRAICACQICSNPKLLEPVYKVEISVPSSSISGVYSVLNKNRGMMEEERRHMNTPILKVIASLPVMESIGFVSKLRQETAGQAFAQMSFSHWQPISGDIYEEGSMVNELVKGIRKRKGLKDSLPQFADFYDKV